VTTDNPAHALDAAMSISLQIGCDGRGLCYKLDVTGPPPVMSIVSPLRMRMFAAINPDAEVGPTGMFIMAGIFALVACGTLVSGLHPRWRATAKWKVGVLRSAFGSLAFSVCLVIMYAGLIVRGILDQHGSFAGIVLWLFCGGAAVLVLGPVYDLVQSLRRQ